MANNLRIVYDNAADRSTIAASSTAGTLVASNLQTDIKSQIWRSTGTTATLTLTWASPELVGMVALPFTSLSPAATIQVQGYTSVGDATPVFDTGTHIAAPSAFGSVAWGTLPLGANAYSYGGGTYAALWFSVTSVSKLVITLVDTFATSGYIEASRIVCGAYWSPTYNAEYGCSITAGDMSKQERSDAGDLKTDRGPRYKILSVDISYMPSADRDQMWRVLLGNGMSIPIFFSLSPDESNDLSLEQIYQVYGKITRATAIKYQFFNQFNTTLEVEEI